MIVVVLAPPSTLSLYVSLSFVSYECKCIVQSYANYCTCVIGGWLAERVYDCICQWNIILWSECMHCARDFICSRTSLYECVLLCAMCVCVCVCVCDCDVHKFSRAVRAGSSVHWLPSVVSSHTTLIVLCANVWRWCIHIKRDNWAYEEERK